MMTDNADGSIATVLSSLLSHMMTRGLVWRWQFNSTETFSSTFCEDGQDSPEDVQKILEAHISTLSASMTAIKSIFKYSFLEKINKNKYQIQMTINGY